MTIDQINTCSILMADRWGENDANIGFTSVGGLAIKVINKTGGASVQGEVVEADSVTDNAVNLTETSDAFAMGVFLESGVPDGEEAWIVIAGKVYVRADAAGFSKPDRLITSSATAGRAGVDNTPSAATHFTEIGHAMSDAAANGLGLMNLHWL